MRRLGFSIEDSANDNKSVFNFYSSSSINDERDQLKNERVIFYDL